MNFEKNSGQVEVLPYFANKISNKSSLNCFGDTESMDYSGFESNLNKYLNEKSITEMIKVNSEIKDILNKFKISIKINMGILNNLLGNHLPQTTKTALGIADFLPQELKTKVNKKALAEATGLHDIAKVIMPENIINKPGALNEKEREIMKEHARLSYEMLKTTDLDKETLNLIKKHHDSPQKINSDKIEDINLQILSIADIYSALREKRSYKAEMTREKALAILEKETNNGKFHPSIYNALVEYSQDEETKLRNRYHKWKIFDLKPINSFGS